MSIASIEEISQFKSSGKVVIVDVRSKAEQESLGNAIEGNVNISYIDDEQFAALVVSENLLPEDKNTPIICHWNKGGRAGKAAAILVGMGYTQVLNGENPGRIHSAN